VDGLVDALEFSNGLGSPLPPVSEDLEVEAVGLRWFGRVGSAARVGSNKPIYSSARMGSVQRKRLDHLFQIAPQSAMATAKFRRQALPASVRPFVTMGSHYPTKRVAR
jgi:hypothetical protein